MSWLAAPRLAAPRLAVPVLATAVLGMAALGGCASAMSARSAGTTAGRGVAAAPATVQGCASFGAAVIRRHGVVASMPPACRGLAPTELSQAIGDAIRETSRAHPKSAQRHLAGVASARLEYLIVTARDEAARQAAAQAQARARAPATAPAGPRAATSGPGWTGSAGAALACWLLTIASGAYLIWGWLARRGWRRRPGQAQDRPANAGRSGGLPPGLLITHFSLATVGLGIWVGFVASGLAWLAWLATATLAPVAGLGMATLIQTIPEPSPARMPPVPVDDAAGSIPVLQEDGTARPAAAVAPARRSGPPAPMVALHGALATATVLLAMLASIAAISH